MRGLPWAAFGQGLKDAVTAGLQRTPSFVTWDPDIVAAFARDPGGLAHSVELVRISIGMLVDAGLAADQITGLRDFLVPMRFKAIADRLYLAADRQVTRLVWVKLVTLHGLAVRCNEFSDAELNEKELTAISAIMVDYKRAHKQYCESNPSRRERLIKDFRDPAIIQALRDLPVNLYQVPLPARVTRAYAAAMKQAAVLALLLDTGLSLVLIRRLVYERHFFELDGELTGCLEVVIPGSETGNGLERRGIVSREYADIVHSFRANFRSSLDICGQSPFLFPGNGIKPLTLATISSQQSRFLHENFDERFSSALVREILKHEILSANPKATGIISAVLGLRDQDYLNRLAKPYDERRKREEMGELVVSGELK